MCAVIFACKAMDASWALGLDPCAPWVGDDPNFTSNHGVGMQYPMGPICEFAGQEIEMFCCCSESGLITAKLLADMLRYLDKYNIFDCSDGVPPFLILDAHGSRFDLQFLEYINLPLHKWNVCIGVPHGTSYWQVGDSTKQSGVLQNALGQRETMATYQEVEQWILVLHRKKPVLYRKKRQTCWTCLEQFICPKGDKQEGNCGTRLGSLELQGSVASRNSVCQNVPKTLLFPLQLSISPPPFFPLLST